MLLWVVRRRAPWRGVLAPAAPGPTALSVALLLILGAPLPGQVWAFILLPLREAWPVLLSALLWFATAAALRSLAVAALPLGREVRGWRADGRLP